MLALLIVAVSVGLDNFGAATSIGVSGIDWPFRIRVAVIFGGLNTTMVLIGLLVGHGVTQDLGRHVKVIAGMILLLMGGYAVVKGFVSRGTDTKLHRPGLKRLIVLGAALGIDNVAVGFALGADDVNVLVGALAIATSSVGLTLVGLEVGSRLGESLGQMSEVVGGLVLVGVGLAIATGLV